MTDPVILDGKLYGQDYKRIKSSLRPLFVDEKVWRLTQEYITSSCFQFPADKYSISYDGRLGKPPKDVDVDSKVDPHWVRPVELYSQPVMIKDGGDRDDVNQGALGNVICSKNR